MILLIIVRQGIDIRIDDKSQALQNGAGACLLTASLTRMDMTRKPCRSISTTWIANRMTGPAHHHAAIGERHV